MEEHPWVNMPYHIEWCKLTPESAKVDFPYMISCCKAKINEISNLSASEINFKNVFYALDDCQKVLNQSWTCLMQLGETCDSEEMRNVVEEVQGEVALFFSSIYLDKKLWEVVESAYKKSKDEKLDDVEKRLIEETMLDFKDGGADLDDEDKDKIKGIEQELVKLTTKYTQNCLDSKNKWELIVEDVKELEGVPESSIEFAKKDAEDHGYPGKYRFTLQYFSSISILKYCKNESLRKKIWEGKSTVGYIDPWNNEPIIIKILELRHKKANILGYNNFADLLDKRRMIKSGENSLKFIEDIKNRVKPKYNKDIEDIKKFQEKVTGEKVEKLKPWNLIYYSESLRKETYNFDDELVKPYFSLDNVLKGLFLIFNKLYDVTITERKTYFRKSENEPKIDDMIEVWHPECKFFEIKDSKTGKLLSSVYCDFFPRETKGSGAWQEQLIIGCPHLGKPHLGVVCANLTRPVEGNPALLTHDDVETIFHEFGHLVHQSFSEVPIRSLAGTNVAFDFGEVPSHFNENFTWEKECLDLFAFHYETKEKLPEKYLQNIIEARNFKVSLDIMKQLEYAKLDLELHINFVKSGSKSIEEFIQASTKDYVYDFDEKSTSIARNFHHLFSDPVGYAAGYYSYKYSEVLEDDMFSRFKKEGILNHSLGMEFKEKILSKGNSKPAGEIFYDFMGREPKLDAYLIRCGIDS